MCNRTKQWRELDRPTKGTISTAWMECVCLQLQISSKRLNIILVLYKDLVLKCKKQYYIYIQTGHVVTWNKLNESMHKIEWKLILIMWQSCLLLLLRFAVPHLSSLASYLSVLHLYTLCSYKTTQQVIPSPTSMIHSQGNRLKPATLLLHFPLCEKDALKNVFNFIKTRQITTMFQSRFLCSPRPRRTKKEQLWRGVVGGRGE